MLKVGLLVVLALFVRRGRASVCVIGEGRVVCDGETTALLSFGLHNTKGIFRESSCGSVPVSWTGLRPLSHGVFFQLP